MEAGAYGGALAELREALRDLSMHDNKGAILNSAKAFESVMKQILRKTSGNYMRLVHELYERGFYDNIPEEIRDGFKESVFVPLSVMRNRMGGHGQGAESYEIPRHYAELAVNIASSYLKFMMEQVSCGQSKIAEKSQNARPTPVVNEDDLPF
jgi:HEPN domain-containing protein